MVRTCGGNPGELVLPGRQLVAAITAPAVPSVPGPVSEKTAVRPAAWK
jgi:hypothetical protein